MTLAQSSRERRLDGAVLPYLLAAVQVRGQCIAKVEAHPANHVGASPALSHQVASAAARFPVVIAPIVHVIPVARSRAVSQRLLWVDRYSLSGAAQRRGHETRSVLDQAIVDKTTRAGQCIESVEVNVGHDADDNAGLEEESSQSLLSVTTRESIGIGNKATYG